MCYYGNNSSGHYYTLIKTKDNKILSFSDSIVKEKTSFSKINKEIQLIIYKIKDDKESQNIRNEENAKNLQTFPMYYIKLLLLINCVLLKGNKRK